MVNRIADHLGRYRLKQTDRRHQYNNQAVIAPSLLEKPLQSHDKRHESTSPFRYSYEGLTMNNRYSSYHIVGAAWRESLPIIKGSSEIIVE
jgi:hypothetical protein